MACAFTLHWCEDILQNPVTVNKVTPISTLSSQLYIEKGQN